MGNALDTGKPVSNEGNVPDNSLEHPEAVISRGIVVVFLVALAVSPVFFAQAFWGFTRKEISYLMGEGPLAVVMVITLIMFAVGIMAAITRRLTRRLYRLIAWALVGCFVASAAIIDWQGTDSSHACFTSSKHAELRAVGCFYVEEVIVVDKVFSYTESHPLIKEVNGKTVNGTLYIVDAGYDGDRKYERGDEIFIPKDDMKNVGYGAYSESKDWTKPGGVFSSGQDFTKRYVIHTTKTELVRPITDPQPNWEEKVEQRFGEPDKGADYVYVGDVFKDQRKHELQGAHLKGGGATYDHVFWNKALVEGS